MSFASPPIANNPVTLATRKRAMSSADNELLQEFISPWKVDLMVGGSNLATGGINLEKLLTAPDGWRNTLLGRN